jgi:hypothetical protein
MPSSPKKHKCLDCGKEYKNKRNLEPHIWLKHTGRDDKEVEASKKKEKERRKKNATEKPFGCSVCKKRFGYKHHAKEHMRVFHSDQNDPKVVAFQKDKNEKRRKESIVTGTSSSASAVDPSTSSSPLGGAAARREKSGCDEVFKCSQHVAQHLVDRIGVNMRISRQS